MRESRQVVEIAFQELVSGQTVGLGCTDAPTMRSVITAAFEETGLDGWAIVEAAVPTANTPCAIATIDPVNHQVAIEFVPDLWTTSTNPTDTSEEP